VIEEESAQRPIASLHPVMRISTVEFSLLRNLIYDRFGINLSPDKKTLVVSRLQKRLKEANFPSFRAYFDFLATNETSAEFDRLINAISTNYSYFYREEKHFHFFVGTVLPWIVSTLKKQKTNDIRIWSAGCSTGEEPYTLAMLMMDCLKAEYSLLDAGILATDISSRVLKIAAQGEYDQESVNRLPAHLRHQFLKNLTNGHVTVDHRLKREVTFRRFNLMNKRFPFKKPFHAIFCRNVMIYFDKTTRDDLVARFYNSLLPGGYLFIGHSETLGREQQKFHFIMPACYQRI